MEYLHPDVIGAALLYTVVGVTIFLILFAVMARVVPFSIRKEIEEDQNTALAIVMAAVILGVAHIIAAAVG